jgi:transposase
VLACASHQDHTGKTNKQVASELGVSLPTVGKWRQRFIENRLEGLHDETRPGAPRKITDEQVEEVVLKTLGSLPKNATHWSTRTMAKATGLSQSAIVRIWHAFAL